MIGAGLRTLLINDSGVSNLIGSRMYPVRLPQSPTVPAIVYMAITGQRFHNTEGSSGLSGPRIQIDCWAATFSETQSLALAVRKVLDGYRGAAGDDTIQGAFFDSERDFFEADAGVSGLYRTSMDFFIYFEEDPTPA